MANDFFFGGNSEQLISEKEKEVVLNTNYNFFGGTLVLPSSSEETVVIDTSNGFFGGNSELEDTSEEIEINTDSGFFGGIEIDSEESTCESGKCSEEGFFRDCANSEDFSRNGGKGKSFNFSVWNSNISYVNDEFKQDFVTYNGKLYACLISNTNTVPGTTKDWVGVIKMNPTWNRI